MPRSSDQLELYEPINVLKPVGPDIWIVDGPQIDFAYLGLKLPFPTRMTLVRLADGALWLHSPIMPDEGLMKQIDGMGQVRCLIAPNSLHYWWLPEWKATFPQAEVHAVPGLRRSAKRPIPIEFELGEVAPPLWRGLIDQVIVPGSMLTEVDFFHRASRTLILTDLIENFELQRVRGGVLRMLIRLFGAADPDGKAPYDMQLSFLGHRKKLRAAVDRMIGWNPEKLVMAHGRWYDRDAVSELRRAFRWAR